MVILIASIVVGAASFLIIKSGHASAVAASEASLRARYDKGEYNEASRKLMREAGYNV